MKEGRHLNGKHEIMPAHPLADATCAKTMRPEILYFELVSADAT